MSDKQGGWCSQCRQWKYSFSADTICSDCKPVRRKVSLEGVTKVCCNCGRELSSRCFIYDQFSDDKLRSDCRTCYSYLNGRPSVTEVLEFEEALKDILSDALRFINNDTEKRRTDFELYIYNRMLNDGLLGTWKPPVWIHKTSMKVCNYDSEVS